MARRSLLPQDTSALGVQFWLANLGYDRVKPMTLFSTRRVAIVLHIQEDPNTPHPLVQLAAASQHAMLCGEDGAPPAVVVLDMTPLLGTGTTAAKALDSESSNLGALGKILAKPTARALEKLLGFGLKEATLIAAGGAAQLLLRLLSRRATERGIRPGSVRRAVLIHPRLGAPCVNAHLSGAMDAPGETPLAVDVLYESAAALERRDTAVRHAFACGRSAVVTGERASILAHALIESRLESRLESRFDGPIDSDSPASTEPTTAPTTVGRFGAADGATGGVVAPAVRAYDADVLDGVGQLVYLSRLSFELSRQSKQHEPVVDDADEAYAEHAAKARRMQPKASPPAAAAVAAAAMVPAVAGGGGGAVAKNGWQATSPTVTVPASTNADETGATEVGALILRGNRCVLVRSLSAPPAWRGMRLPTAFMRAGETPVDTALRAASELCDIDGMAEVDVVHSMPPIALYRTGGRRVDVHVLYAVRLPPVELVDCSDDDDLYDWYTYPRAINALQKDEASLALLRTVAYGLAAAAAAGVVEDKWGGVFGQESQDLMAAAASVPAAAAPTDASGTPLPVTATDANTVAAAAQAAHAAAEAAAMAARAALETATSLGYSLPTPSADLSSLSAIATFTWRAHRPLHPLRLHAASVGGGGPLRDCAIGGVGWLVTRHDEQAIINGRGAALRVTRGPPWWDATPTCDWPAGLAQDLKVSGLWHEPYGDRQTELRVEAAQAGVTRARVEAALEACLLTDAEIEAGPDAWDEIPDPFLEADGMS